MVILFNSYGDHSNRLFQNIRIEVYCIENKIKFRNTTFSDLCNYYIDPVDSSKNKFANLLKNRIVKFFLQKSRLINIISFTGDKYNISILKKCFYKNCYIEGWYYENNLLTSKYQSLMIKKYSLKEDYYIQNPIYMNMLSIDNSIYVFIGIHIRRGDYKTWNDGKYYFTDDEYKIFMTQMENEIQIHENKKCIFIIFSNEKTSFKETDTIWISKSSWYLDHFLMGKCNYLIGPPSTFTMWASYIGKTKYLHVKGLKQQIKYQDFDYWL